MRFSNVCMVFMRLESIYASILLQKIATRDYYVAILNQLNFSPETLALYTK